MILSANLRQHPSANFHHFHHDLPLRSSPSSTSASTPPALSFDAFSSATASPSDSLIDYSQSAADYYMQRASSQKSHHQQSQQQQQRQQQRQQQQARLTSSPATSAVASTGADDGSLQDASWFQPNNMAQVASQHSQSHQQTQQQQQQQQQQPQQQHHRIRFPGAYHLREGSGSTIVSAGPSSPYASSPHLGTQAYPHIVDPDSQHLAATADAFEGDYQLSALTSFPKQIPTGVSNRTFTESLFSPQFENFSPNAAHDAAQYLCFMRQAMAQQQEQGGPGMASGAAGHATISRTQSVEELIDGEPRLQLARAAIPQLGRTISEAYQDELYNPQNGPTSALAASQHPTASAAPVSPTQSSLKASDAGYGTLGHTDRRDFVSELMQAANSNSYTARSQSPATSSTTATTASRDRSPYHPGHARQQFADGGFAYPSSPVPRLNSAAKMRAQQKAEDEARAERHGSIDNNPKTISPNLIDKHEIEDDVGPSQLMLFPPLRQPQQQPVAADGTRGGNSPAYSVGSSNSSSAQQQQQQQQQRRVAAHAVPQVPQQYPFIAHPRRPHSGLAQTAGDTPLEFPAHPQLTSMESTKSESGPLAMPPQVPQHRRSSSGARREEAGSASDVDEEYEAEENEQQEEDENDDDDDDDQSDDSLPPNTPLQRPAHTTADSGTYTCTYHGCTLRFETPAKLQKHKREAHRQTSPNSAAAAAAAAGSTTPVLNSQAGPHRCDRINPSTGKQCNSVFSRPYDLTRHEDTIHNARKQKVRCQLCTEEKTFSRNDALTRHMRVVHPDWDFPGKSKKRSG